MGAEHRGRVYFTGEGLGDAVGGGGRFSAGRVLEFECVMWAGLGLKEGFSFQAYLVLGVCFGIETGKFWKLEIFSEGWFSGG